MGKLFDIQRALRFPIQPSNFSVARSYHTTASQLNTRNSPIKATMSASKTMGPNDGVSSDKATPAMSVGSATAYGHGDHPKDNADESNVKLPGSKVGPQQEDLDGEQMRAPGEGDVMNAQFDKENAGWGEQDSLTSDLDRQKAEQKEARDAIKAVRQGGGNVDGGAQRVTNEGNDAV